MESKDKSLFFYFATLLIAIVATLLADKAQLNSVSLCCCLSVCPLSLFFLHHSHTIKQKFFSLDAQHDSQCFLPPTFCSFPLLQSSTSQYYSTMPTACRFMQHFLSLT